VPESTEQRRSRIRSHLAVAVPELQHLSVAAGSRLAAPDPESALVYLRELRDLVAETLDHLDA
jgi:hypothetical protein